MCGWVLLSVALVQAVTAINSFEELAEGRFDWSSWWFLKVGATFADSDAIWLLPTFLALVLALYATLASRTLTEAPQSSVLRIRRQLVPAGSALSALVTFFCASAVVATVTGSTDGTRMPGILAVSVAIVLLGIRVGRFETHSRHQKLRRARLKRAYALLRLSALDEQDGALADPDEVRGGARRIRFATVLVLNAVCVILLATVTQVFTLTTYGLPLEGLPVFVAVLTALNLMLTWLGLFAPAFLISTAYDARGRWRGVCSVSARVFSTAFLWPAVSILLTDGSIGQALFFAVPGVVCFCTVQLSLFPSVARLPLWLRRVSVRFAVFHAARGVSLRAIAAADRDIVELSAVG